MESCISIVVKGRFFIVVSNQNDKK